MYVCDHSLLKICTTHPSTIRNTHTVTSKKTILEFANGQIFPNILMISLYRTSIALVYIPFAYNMLLLLVPLQPDFLDAMQPFGHQHPFSPTDT